jgi:predicted O-methyltransferase YrrM
MPITRNRPSVKLEPRRYDAAGLPTRYFNPGELDALLHLFESVEPDTIIEFGVNTGRTAAAALRNLPGLRQYVGVDVERAYQARLPVQRKEVPAEPGALAAGDSRFALVVKARGSFDLHSSDLPLADAVFIDADHSEQGVRNDTALAMAVVRPGGVIVWHDDNELPQVQVTQTLNALQDDLGIEITHVTGTWLSFYRVPK